eukprot:4447582-Amphidinium_carterae.1
MGNEAKALTELSLGAWSHPFLSQADTVLIAHIFRDGVASTIYHLQQMNRELMQALNVIQ